MTFWLFDDADAIIDGVDDTFCIFVGPFDWAIKKEMILFEWKTTTFDNVTKQNRKQKWTYGIHCWLCWIAIRVDILQIGDDIHRLDPIWNANVHIVPDNRNRVLWLLVNRLPSVVVNSVHIWFATLLAIYLNHSEWIKIESTVSSMLLWVFWHSEYECCSRHFLSLFH